MVRRMQIAAQALHSLSMMLNPPLQRVIERGQRGQTLEAWGLNPHRADPNTSMAKDDDDGFDKKIPEGVTGTVMYPIMNATDALATLNVVLQAGKRSVPFRYHAPSVLASCRTAFESSAQAIWVMSPEDRDVRRARAAGLAMIGVEHAKEYHKDTIKAHDNKLLLVPDETYGQSQHRLNFHQSELDTLAALPRESGRRYTVLVRKAANWIQDNNPAHTAELAGKQFPTIMDEQYRVCSSFTHGHSWAINLADGPSAMFAMMADALMSAIISVECAVALYEAQTTDPASARTHNYPERLQPSIDAWRVRYA